jgi:chemotaxis signal transduction protein
VVRIRPSAIQPPPEDIRSSHTIYLIGVAELERTLVLLLDLEKVLSFRAGVVGAA